MGSGEEVRWPGTQTFGTFERSKSMDRETRVDDQRVATRPPTGNDPAGRGVRGPFGVGFGPPGSTDYIYKFTLKGVLFHFASTVGQFWVAKRSQKGVPTAHNCYCWRTDFRGRGIWRGLARFTDVARPGTGPDFTRASPGLTIVAKDKLPQIIIIITIVYLLLLFVCFILFYYFDLFIFVVSFCY